MKRIGSAAALAVWLLLCALIPAMAGEKGFDLVDQEGNRWITFDLQPGMDCLPSPLGEEPFMPQGLEAMYAWMQPLGERPDTWFFRMAKGRVLASASRTPLDMDLSAKDLVELWPLMVSTIEKNVQYVDDKPECAAIITQNGREWLHVQTQVVLGGEKMLSVKAEGFAICDQGVLVEVWLASPTPATYRYDDAAMAEMQEDLETALQWKQSIALPLP